MACPQQTQWPLEADSAIRLRRERRQAQPAPHRGADRSGHGRQLPGRIEPAWHRQVSQRTGRAASEACLLRRGRGHGVWRQEAASELMELHRRPRGPHRSSPCRAHLSRRRALSRRARRTDSRSDGIVSLEERAQILAGSRRRAQLGDARQSRRREDEEVRQPNISSQGSGDAESAGRPPPRAPGDTGMDAWEGLSLVRRRAVLAEAVREVWVFSADVPVARRVRIIWVGEDPPTPRDRQQAAGFP